MAPRASLPGELFLDAIKIYPEHQIDIYSHGGDEDYGRRILADDATRGRAAARPPHVALRWVLNPALGIPPAPFTAWRRPVSLREPAQPITGWHQAGDGTFEWDGVSEMLRIEIDLSGPATVTGLHRADLGPVQTVSGTAGDTVVLDAGPMLAVRADNPAAVGAARGQSLTLMANGDNWHPFEIVGLPFDPQQLGATYYEGAQQGLAGALTDPFSAAVARLERWGPVLGWGSLAGLPPWVPPEPEKLVTEMQGDLLGDLVQIMTADPPPQVGNQIAAEVVHRLDQIGQVIGSQNRALNTGGPGDDSQITVRPLQALTTSAATDAWASLALGFGTGDPLGAAGGQGQQGEEHDYMVTAPWHGMMKTAVPVPWPWPWDAPPPIIIEAEAERELAAVFLTPRERPPPGAPSPLTAGLGHDEGAGSDLLREHPLGRGWIPVGSAAPVPEPGTPPDPGTPPNTVTLRDSGVPRPGTGPQDPPNPPHVFQYYAAAADLFGQWSPWATAWYSLPAAAVQAPVVAAVKARAAAGPGGTDPCAVTVTTEIVWNIRERSLHRLELCVDAYTPTPPPPGAYDAPPDMPQGGAVTVDTVGLTFSRDGTPGAPGTPDAPPAGVDVLHVLDDDTPVDTDHPAGGDERRYRITIHDLPVVFAGRPEVAVAVYARAEETIRPGERSGWTHAREAAIAANPIPPPPCAPLPAVYPAWASLPDAAGLSYASVTWTPSGAWRYRVYEATEAALRAACDQPGPVLTDGLAERMQALFELYQVPANLPKLKQAFRKLGTEPVLPPAGPDGAMRFDTPLPRGSSLIHCYVVAGVTESNMISSWPQPDADGRGGFDAYVIPHPARPALPQIRAALDGAGVPQVTVNVDGAVAATHIRLYRAANAILARSTGTMERVATVPAGNAAPGSWKTTVIPDPGAPTGWSRLQYRAVAVTGDDPDRAGMAVPSEPSRSFALLSPPPDPPALALTANVQGSTPTASIVRVDTDALRHGTDVGDFAIAATVTPAGRAPVRFSSSLRALPYFTTTAALAASTEPAGYVGHALHLRLSRAAGQALNLTADLTDPLARAAHAALTVQPAIPDPPPVLTLTADRIAGIVWLHVDTNMPLPPDPARDWTLRITTQLLYSYPPQPAVASTFQVSAIPTIPNGAAMPNPAIDPAPFQIRRVDGSGAILAWGRATVTVRLNVQLTNSDGLSDTAIRIVS